MIVPPRGDPVALTKALVAIDSQNPSLVRGGAGEDVVASTLAYILAEWGIKAQVQEVKPDRLNVVARVGKPGGRSIMFNGHLDVVGVESMRHDPFDPVEKDGRIYGRGSADMKGGIAAMCAAAVRAADAGLDGEIVIAAVCDEEFGSIGTQHLIDTSVRADVAIVTEPTSLAIMPAHKGFVWLDANFVGRAAHGSRHDIGVDAIRYAGLFLAELHRYDNEVLAGRNHPLLGRPSVHASTIIGGTEMSTYPEFCRLALERRTIPGETGKQVQREIDELLERVAKTEPRLRAYSIPGTEQNPSDVSPSSPIVEALAESLKRFGLPASIAGMTAWTDAALLNGAGIPAICFGPGDISLAHAAEEYVPVKEIETATRVLTDLALRWTAKA